MTIYRGAPLCGGPVCLVSAEEHRLAVALKTAEITGNEKAWFERARADDAIHYFSMQRDDRLVGQIIIHDIDWAAREGMVGYHIFQPADRDRGDGTAALQAVCRYAFEQLDLCRLVAITTYDNAASRRIAVKAGFRETGPAREGLHLVAYELRRPVAE